METKDTNMETKELKIEIPAGYEIDKEKSTFEKIVFKKKKDTKPRSWEEYCKSAKENCKYGYIINDTNASIERIDWGYLNIQSTSNWRNVIPSKELAEAFLAMMQLMSLRQEWIHKWSIDRGLTNDWEPEWNGANGALNYCIVILDNKYTVERFSRYYQALSFPTEEMANDFMNCFKDLLEIAKP